MPSLNPYKNHPRVNENEVLLRRIHYSHIRHDKSGECIPSSAAFKCRDLSVDIKSKTTPEKSLGFSSALSGFKATVPIRLGYEVVEDPLPQNPAHAIILGSINRRNARLIRDECYWVIEPKIL